MKNIKVILVGAGDRGMIYARQSLEKPERFQIVGVVEPLLSRRQAAGDLFGIPEERRFSSIEEAVAREKFADAIFNCTMDSMHTESSIQFMEKGYHMLLEKPIATNRADARAILDCARRTNRIVMICHVLRYAPFYREIKRRILAGELGTIINLQMAEQVSYFHQSVSYVRGKYADPEICGSGMLLSKCSHDLDIMAWLMSGNKPKQVFSAGTCLQFRPENAPRGARERCLPDCPHVDCCPYSCKTLYVEHPQRWANRVWNDYDLMDGTDEEKLRALAETDNRYGRCVYQAGGKIVDHQSVMVLFESGATATMSMTGGASAAERTIHIVGTKGEIVGTFESERFELRRIAPRADGGRVVETVDVSQAQQGDAHGMGDKLILNDFLALLKGETPSVSCTSLEDSLIGHEIAYAAEENRAE